MTSSWLPAFWIIITHLHHFKVSVFFFFLNVCPSLFLLVVWLLILEKKKNRECQGLFEDFIGLVIVMTLLFVNDSFLCEVISYPAVLHGLWVDLVINRIWWDISSLVHIPNSVPSQTLGIFNFCFHGFAALFMWSIE